MWINTFPTPFRAGKLLLSGLSAHTYDARVINLFRMSQHIRSLLIRNSSRTLHLRWWGFVWRGMVVSRSGKHYEAMGRAVWLFLYLIIHANRRTGTLYRRIRTIARDMHISERTIQFWMKTLRDNGYITTERTGRSLIIHIAKWRPVGQSNSVNPRSTQG